MDALVLGKNPCGQSVIVFTFLVTSSRSLESQDRLNEFKYNVSFYQHVVLNFEKNIGLTAKPSLLNLSHPVSNFTF